MRHLLLIFVILSLQLSSSDARIIERNSSLPAERPVAQMIKNDTGTKNSSKASNLQELSSKRKTVPKAPEAGMEAAQSQAHENQDEHHNQNVNKKNNTKQTAEKISRNKNNERADVMQSALVPPSMEGTENFPTTDDDITKASQEVAEISRLIGKPLTDSHALSMLKNILLEKIHSKLEESKDTATASSKTTEEGVSKFVAALAASKKKSNGQDGKENQADVQAAAAQTMELHKVAESKERSSCSDKSPTANCKYLQKLGLCDSKAHGQVKERCQMTCDACQDCSNCGTIECGGSVCIGSEVAPAPPAAPPPVPAPAPVPPPEAPPVAPPVAPPPPPPVPAPLPAPSPAPQPLEPAHVDAAHAHDVSGHALGTTAAPAVTMAPVHPTTRVVQAAPLPTMHRHMPTEVPAAPPPPCPLPTQAPVPPPCKPEAPTCPPPRPQPTPTPAPAVACVPQQAGQMQPSPAASHFAEAQTGASAHVHPAVNPSGAVVSEASHDHPTLTTPHFHNDNMHNDKWHNHHNHGKPTLAAATIQPEVPHPTTVAPVAANTDCCQTKPEDGACCPTKGPGLPAAGAPLANAPVAGAPAEPVAGAPVAPLVVNPAQKVQPTMKPIAAEGPSAATGVCCAPDPAQKCSNPVDIGLLLDSSANVRGRWGYIKNFAKSLIERFKMGEFARFGIIQFDTIAKFPIRLETYNDAEMLKLHVQKLLMNPYGKRRTDDALKLARDDLFRTARSGVRRAMVIITNGRTNGDDPTINWSQMIVEPSREIQEAGIEVFAVGVTKNAAQEELRIMATDPDTQHVYQAPTFDQLPSLVDPIATRICHGWTTVLSSESNGIHLTTGGSVMQPIAGSLYRPTGPYGCEVKYAKIGCFNDDGNNPRPLPEELFTDQTPTSSVFTGRHIDYDHWDQYLPDVVCRCAKMADRRGYKLFALQLFGSCWSGARAGETYATDGEADQEMCVSFGYKKCEATDSVCVGKQQTNFVYTLDDESRRSIIPSVRST